MSEYTDAKDAKAGKKHQFAVVRAEGLQGLQDLLNTTEGGKVESWHQVGSGATFIVVMSGVPVAEPVKDAPPVDEDEGNGTKAKKKSA